MFAMFSKTAKGREHSFKAETKHYENVELMKTFTCKMFHIAALHDLNGFFKFNAFVATRSCGNFCLLSLSQMTEKLQDMENEAMAKIVELEKQLMTRNKELEAIKVSSYTNFFYLLHSS